MSPELQERGHVWWGRAVSQVCDVSLSNLAREITCHADRLLGWGSHVLGIEESPSRSVHPRRVMLAWGKHVDKQDVNSIPDGAFHFCSEFRYGSRPVFIPRRHN